MRLLTHILNVLAIVVGVLYITGLLIVNIDLGWYGLQSLDLVQAEYVLVGVLWSFLVGVALAGLVAFFWILGLVEKLFQDFSLWKIPRVALGLGFACAGSAIGGFMIWQLLDLLLHDAASVGWAIVIVAYNSISVVIVMSTFVQAESQEKPALGLQKFGSTMSAFFSLKDPTALIAAGFGGIIFILLPISLYAVEVFPYLSRIFGGGRKPQVCLVLKEKAPIPWHQGIWVSQDGKRIGPVVLLQDKGNTLAITGYSQPNAAISASDVLPAIEVNKDLILAVRYITDPSVYDILLVGGKDHAGKSVATAEYYFPKRGVFSAVQDITGRKTMARGREGHTITRLHVGSASAQVLITGGEESSGATMAVAEIYKQWTANRSTSIKFEDVGVMAVDRRDHTATLLDNSMVLIAGGRGKNGTLRAAELYHQGNFHSTGHMTTARYQHTATPLPPKTGARAGQVLIAGGIDVDGVLSLVEIYNPRLGTFARTGSMTDSRAGHTATLLNNGTVLIVGGTGLREGLKTAEIYDPGPGTFSCTGSMTDSRAGHTATLLHDGTVLIAGGSNNAGNILSSAEIYDPWTGTLTVTGSMTDSRAGHTATLLNNGTVLLAGGSNNAGNILSSAEIYDPWTGTLTVADNMTHSRAGHTAVLLRPGSH